MHRLPGTSRQNYDGRIASSPSFEISQWFGAFSSWMRESEQTDAIIEMLADSANELLLNPFTALHMRRYGRANGITNLWARCEWAKADISVGVASKKFSDWNSARSNNEMGALGHIEVKLLYGHYAEKDKISRLETLQAQLLNRCERFGENRQYFGLIWYFLYARDGDWDAEMKRRASDPWWSHQLDQRGLKTVYPDGLQPELGHFFNVGSLDMSSIWPLERQVRGTVGVTMRPADCGWHRCRALRLGFGPSRRAVASCATARDPPDAIEHRSRIDRWMPFRLWEYLAKIWRWSFTEDCPNEKTSVLSKFLFSRHAGVRSYDQLA